jgi:hypothetical protein
LPDIAPSIIVQNGRADFGVPKHLDALALCVGGNAGEADSLQVSSIAPQFLDEPRPAAQLNKAPLPYHFPHRRFH